MQKLVLRPLASSRRTMKMSQVVYRSAEPQSLTSSEQGFTMVEVLIALALTGLTVVCFLAALTTVSKSTITADEHSTADSLAVSQMEYILGQGYDDTTSPPEYVLLSDIPDGWSVNAIAERLDPENDGIDDDDGIQEIRVMVSRGSKQIVALTTRKVNTAYVP